MSMPRYTPFHPRTGPLMESSQAWRRWAGYFVASCYEASHEREYAAIRNSAALIDVTPLWKYMVEGKDAEKLLDRVVTRDVKKCKVGQVQYTAWCDSHGKIVDDGTIQRLGPTSFRFTAADPSLRWLSLNATGMEVAISDASFTTCALALQGPLSRAILQAAAEGDIAGLKFFGITPAKIGGVPVHVSRTGYTGDLGYEIWIPSEQAVTVWDHLMKAGAGYGITPAGIWALDTARIEAGLIMLEVDYVSAHKAITTQQLSTPYELNLGWAVSLKKDDFVGKAALVEEQKRGPAWQLVGIEVDWVQMEALYMAADVPPRLPGVALRASVPLYADERQVGYCSSSVWSPLLKKFIAMAHVEAAFAAPGTQLEMEIIVEHYRKRTPCSTAQLPFFNPERKRA
jgi:aminomethyltransferase